MQVWLAFSQVIKLYVLLVQNQSSIIELAAALCYRNTLDSAS
jgi:hypothetical protein